MTEVPKNVTNVANEVRGQAVTELVGSFLSRKMLVTAGSGSALLMLAMEFAEKHESLAVACIVSCAAIACVWIVMQGLVDMRRPS